MRFGGRIEEDAAFEERAMEVGDERPDVARGVLAAERAFSKFAEKILISRGKTIGVGFVDGVDVASLGHAHVLMAQDVGADGGIEREAEDSAAGAVHKNRRRPVDHVSGGDLLDTRLKDGRFGSHFGRTAVDGKDGTDVDVDVDVGRAIERVENDGVFAGALLAIEGDRLLVFFRDERGDGIAQPEAMQQRIVGINIKLLLLLTLYVDFADIAEDIEQARAADFGLGHFGGEGESGEQPGESSAGMREALLFVQDMLLDGSNHGSRVILEYLLA